MIFAHTLPATIKNLAPNYRGNYKAVGSGNGSNRISSLITQPALSPRFKRPSFAVFTCSSPTSNYGFRFPLTISGYGFPLTISAYGFPLTNSAYGFPLTDSALLEV